MRKPFLRSLVEVTEQYRSLTKTLQTSVVLLLLCAVSNVGRANVSLSGVSSLTICPTAAIGGGSPAFTTVPNFNVNEGSANDISTSTILLPDQLILAAPTGWQFNTGTLPTVTFTPGRDITSITPSYSGGNLVLSIVASGTSNFDQITISNLQVQATATTSFPGNIYATTALGVAGITTGSAGTNFGALQLNSSPTVPSVTISASPGGSVCAGTNITFTPAPTNGGGSPTYQWYVNGTDIGPGSTYSISTLSNGNTVSCVMTSSAAGCVYPTTANSNTVTATISPAPTAVTVTGAGTYCGSGTLTASNGGSGTIYYEGTTTGGTSTLSPSTTVTVSSSGVYYFRAQSAAGCWGTEGSAAVTINPVPAAVVVSGGGSFCAGSTNLTASGGGGGTIYFQGTTSGGTSTASPYTGPVSVSSSGTYYFNAESGSGCWGTQGSATVALATPPTDNAGSPQTVCSGGSVTLAGTFGGAATAVTWTAPSGSFSDPTSPTSTYTPSISSGNVTLTLTSNNPSGPPCSAAVSSVVITVNQAPTDNAGVSQTVCSNGSITLGGSIGGSATSATWSASSGSFSNASSLSSTYSPGISSGTVILTLTSNNPGGPPCSAATSNVTITVDQAATANAGSPQTECGDGALTLAGTIGGSATSSTWSAASGSFSNVSSLTSTYTPTIVSGNVTLTLTTNDPDGAGPCTAATSNVVMTVDQAPTANAGVPQTVCSSGSITLGGSIGGAATAATWSASSGTFSNVNSLTSTYTPGITSGTVVLTLTTNNPGGPPCSPATSTVVITVDQAATANAGSPTAVCSGSTITLGGTIGGGATSSTWSAVSGAFSNVSSLTSTYTPSITSGNVTVTLTTNDPDGAGPCTAAVSSFVVTVDQAPTDNAGAPQTVCSNGTITLGGSFGGSATAATWTSSAGGVFSNINSPTSTYTPAVLTGMVTLTLTTNNPGGLPCSAATSSVVITVNEASLVNAGPNQTVCQGSTITLDGSEGGATTTTTWTGPSGVFSDAFVLTSSYTPSVVSGPVVLTLTGNDPDGPGPCLAPTSTMTVTVNQAPTDNAGPDQVVCSNGSITLAGAIGGAATASTWSASSGTFSNVNSLTSTYSPTVSSGPVVLTLTSNNPSGAPCVAAVSTMTVTVDQAPTDTTGGPYVVCSNSTLTLAGIIGGSATSSNWTATSGSFSDPTSLTAVYTPVITSGQVILTLTSNSGPGPCLAAVQTTTVTVSQAPTDNAGLAQSVCAGGTVTLAGSIGGSATSSSWNASSGTFSNITSLTSTYTPSITSGVINLTLTTNAGPGPCLAAVSTVPITVDPLPAAVTVTGAGTYCTSETLTADNGGDGTIYFEGTTSNGTSTAIPSATEIETVSGTYYFRAESAAGCWGPQGSAAVAINSVPVAYAVTGGGAYCSGGTGEPVGLSNSTAGISYQLYLDYAPFGAPVVSVGGAFNFASETSAGYYTVIATNTGTGCTNDMTGGVAVVILPLPNLYSVGGGGSYCAGGSGVDVNLTGSDLGVNYQLIINGVPGMTMAGTGGSLDFGPQTTAGNYQVVATSTSSGCQQTMSGTVTVSINLLPTVYNVTGGGTQCAGGTGVAVGLNGSQAGFSYQLYNGSTVYSTPATGPGGLFTLTSVTASGTYTVSATNPATGCTNNMNGDAVVTINPLPNVHTVTGGGGYCAGGTGVHIGLNGSDAGVNYQLYIGITGLTTLGGPGILDFGTETVAGSYDVIATNTVTLCAAAMTGTVTVTVNPLPTVYTVGGGGAYCAGTSGAPVTLTGSDAGVDYYVYVGGVMTGGAVTGTGALGTFLLGDESTVGTYTVSATNPITNCSSNMSGSVNVSLNPAPTPYSVTGGGTYCSGGAGFHVGLALSQAGSYVYNLYDNGTLMVGPVAGTGGALDFGPQTAAGTYTVVATNTSTTCSGEMTGSAVIIVDPLPTVYTVTGGGSYCAGGSGVSINTSGSDTSTDYQMYSSISGIVGSAVLGGTGGLSFIASPAGTYTVVATSSVTGCTNNMAGNPVVTVNPLPSPISGPTNICLGTSTTLTDITSSGSWSSSNMAIGSINSTTGFLIGMTTGVYSVSYTLTTTGCLTSTIDTVSAVPVLPAITGPADVCEAGTDTLSDATSGGTWSSSNGAIATIDVSLGIVTGVAPGTVTMTYTLSTVTGCVVSVYMTDTVKASPVVDLITGSVSNLCAGLTADLSDATTGGVWSSGNTAIGTINSMGIVTGITPGVVDISYTVTNGFGCSTSAVSAVTVGPVMPAATVSPSAATICHGLPVTLSVVTGAGVSFQWYLSGSAIPGANGASFVTGTAGSYSVELSNGSCTETLPVTVAPPPSPVIFIDSVGHYLYTSSFTSYQWYHDSVLIPGAITNIIPEDTAAGTYFVVVSDANGCFDTSALFTIYVDTSLSAPNISYAARIKVFPNPASTILNISAPVRVLATITGADGRVYMEKNEATTISITELPDGVYFISIFDENNNLLKTDRFVKMQ